MKKLILSAALMLSAACNTWAAVRYVTPAGAGSKNGLSWANASNDIQAMINAAAAGDEIWVAAGVYLPNRRIEAPAVITPNNRNNSFLLKKNVALYGGFTGSESVLGARNWQTNVTILSGDLGVPGDKADNCYHVVVFVDTTGDAYIDGFTIKYGNANTDSTIELNTIAVFKSVGGAVYSSSKSKRASLTISNCNVSDNSAIYACVIHAQSIVLNINSCVLKRNVGGCISSHSARTSVINSEIAGNTSPDDGGATIINFQSNFSMINTGIYQNSGFASGGIDNLTSVSQLVNCTLSDNTLNSGADKVDIHNRFSSITKVYNSIVGYTMTSSSPPCEFHNSLSDGLTAADGNHDRSLYTDAAVFADAAAGNYRLAAGSPAIDAGDNSFYTGVLGTDKDLADNPRLAGAGIDIGAYEKIVPSGITDLTQAGNGISLQPNPALTGTTAILTFNNTQMLQGGGTITIADRSGRIVSSVPVAATATQAIALPEAAGLYLLQVNTRHARTTLKIVVQ